jgi:hypothetical protein
MIRAVFHLARADFLERTRRYSFLITLAVAIYATWGFVPPNGAAWSTLTIHHLRGVYNSAWVGAQVAMLTSVFLTLVGFYLVKNAVDRDDKTRVGQIIAATPMSRFQYTLGKMASNTGVLLAITGVMVVVAAVMQFIRAEDRTFDLVGLVTPFLYVLVPVCCIVGALAILFECVPLLRGGLGNVAYFFLSVATLSSQLLEGADFFGLKAYLSSMKAAAMAAYPGTIGPDWEMNIGINIPNADQSLHLNTFPWSGAQITSSMIVSRLEWIAVAVGIALVGGVFFDRFDSARGAGAAVKRPGRLSRLSDRITQLLWPDTGPASIRPGGHLTPIPAANRSSRLLAAIQAETRILLKGQHPVWYLGSLTLVILGLTLPLSAGISIIFPIAFIWPTLLWSPLGCREMRQATNQIVFSAPRPLARQLPSAWLAGSVVGLVVGSGVGLRLLLAGDPAGVAAWVVGSFFVPALAIACGTWTKGTRLFETVYLFWWYAGPLNRVPTLDFVGAAGALHTPGITAAYALVTVGLFALAILGRRRQILV